jgi:hypothetical protein
MCDYSLHNIASRPARVGDKLTTTTFRHTCTRGFAAVGEPDVAVCLSPGTEIAFEDNVRCDGRFWPFSRQLHDDLARFRQIDLDKPYNHHDALEFSNGQVVLVTQLVADQRAVVLQLPTTTAVAVETRETLEEEAGLPCLE